MLPVQYATQNARANHTNVFNSLVCRKCERCALTPLHGCIWTSPCLWRIFVTILERKILTRSLLYWLKRTIKYSQRRGRHFYLVHSQWNLNVLSRVSTLEPSFNPVSSVYGWRRRIVLDKQSRTADRRWFLVGNSSPLTVKANLLWTYQNYNNLQSWKLKDVARI